jgi:MFS transporter, DHA1 family, tetracycline resistance protein
MSTNKHLHATTFALFFVLLIDGISQGLIFPILTNTLISINSHEFVSHLSIEGRNILYGVCLGVFFLCWFIGAPILGDLSDAIGRRKALLICLVGAVIGFLLTALAFLFHSIALLILGRVIGGFTTGSQPIAQATIVDLCDPNKKARYMALIILAVSIGFILGPTIGGVFSDPHLVSWFNNETPLYIATALALANIVLLFYSFKESSNTHHAIKANLASSLRVFISAFKHPAIKSLTITFLILQGGWMMYQVFASSYLAQRYTLTFSENAIFMIMVGIGASVGFVLCGICEKRFQARSMIASGYGILGLCILLTLLVPSYLFAWLIAIPACASLALGYTFIMKLYSAQVGADKQGWAMGIAGGVAALVSGLAAVISGLLAAININIPLIAAICLLVIGCILIFKWRKRYKE